MKGKFLILIAALTIFFTNCFFTVNEKETALIFQFGEFVRANDSPGLAFKVPFIQEVRKFSKMVLHLNTDEKEVITREQKRLIVNAYAKYQITDALQFFRTVSDDFSVRKRLNAIFDSSLRQVIGGIYLSDLLSSQRADIMRNIKDIINVEAQKFGINLLDVRILRADLPEENSNGIYRRMQTDREKEAKEIRAQGAEESSIIKAKADKESQILIAEAEKTANLTKGEGDYLAGKIYSTAYNQDPEFFAFYRSIQAYKDSLLKENTSILLSLDNDFLKFFNNSK